MRPEGYRGILGAPAGESFGQPTNEPSGPYALTPKHGV